MYFFKIYINYGTPSLPRGIYIMINKTPELNDIAVACIPDEVARYGVNRGYIPKGICRNGSMPVMKKIFGLPGDSFEIKNGVLHKNSKIISNFPIFEFDSRGRALKNFYNNKQILNTNEHWLMSDYADNSWDSRYYGAIKISYLLKPLLILE